MTKHITKILTFLTTFLIFVYLSITNVYAIENPLETDNNRFGIHILEEKDIGEAAILVNSSGGDWGYATLVIRTDERDLEKWQRVFDKMRRLHLIPIVRIASRQKGVGWEKLKTEDIESWVYFLNSLNWVVKNRYIIVGNEPNHASEWEDEVNPKEYADYLRTFSQQIKEASEDFFILPAGLDASAPDGRYYMSEELFIEKMIESDPKIFDYIDGWTSHSYPNSNPYIVSGRSSIKTYDWEIALLKDFGIERDLPIFITETGWKHDRDGSKLNKSDPLTVSESIKKSFNEDWSDKRIAAVTPFVLNYQKPPFDTFSWKKTDEEYYDFYYDYQDIPKNGGKPVQVYSGEIVSFLIPHAVKRNESFFGMAYILNNGQSIWKSGDIELTHDNTKVLDIHLPYYFSAIEPGQKSLILFKGDVSKNAILTDNLVMSFWLARDNQPFSKSYPYKIDIYQEQYPDKRNLFQRLKSAILYRIQTIKFVSAILASF